MLLMLYMQGHDVNTHGRLIASNTIDSVAVVLWVLLPRYASYRICAGLSCEARKEGRATIS